MKLRGRLALAFAAVWLPTALGAGLGYRQIDLRLRQAIDAQLATAVKTTRAAVERELARIDAELTGLVEGDPDRFGGLASTRAGPLDVRALESLRLDVSALIDWSSPEGVVVVSAHLPASSGFAAPPYASVDGAAGVASVMVRGNPPRSVPALVRVRSVPSPQPAEGSPPASIIGGVRLDGRWLEDLARLAGVRVGLSESASAEVRWFGPEPSSSAVATRTVPLPRLPGGPLAALQIVVDYGPWARVRASAAAWAAGSLAASAVLAIALALALAQRLGRPIADLAGAARRVAAGDLETRVPARGSDEVAQLAGVFNEMVTDLERSRSRLARAERLAAWREVARRVAHEVKNPLSPIRMAVENVRKSVRRQHPDTAAIVERSTNTVLEEVRSIDRLVSEFAELARLPPPRFEAVAWAPLLEDLRARHDGVFPGVKTHLRVEVRTDRASRLDAEQILRALSNLVKNAGEALDPGPGRIEIGVREAGGGVEVWVEDDGPGLSVEPELAFQPHATSKASGSGLGLAIAEQIVMEHGGDLRHEPVSPSGARFVAFLPDAPGP